MVERTPYLLTFGTYGTRLHGDARGSWEPIASRRSDEPLPRDDFRSGFESRRMAQPPFSISSAARPVIERAILEVCRSRGWTILAVNVRTEHIHVVVAADDVPEKVMHALKAFSTRALRERQLVGRDRRIWARHGSTRYLLAEGALEAAVDYVLHRQGAHLPGSIFLPSTNNRRD